MADTDTPSTGDGRAEKTGIPEYAPIALAEVGNPITIVPNVPRYWEVRNEDPVSRYEKSNFKWAINHYTRQAIAGEANVDLRVRDTDRTVPYDWISDLQRDLYSFGYKSVLADKRTGALPPPWLEPDGVFDERCERVVRRFQIHASLNVRQKKDGGPTSVASTFKGKVNGIVDDETKREIEIWLTKGYKRVLQPFDPEEILKTQHAAGLICPKFYELLISKYCEECDEQDLEPYGPCAQSCDEDGYRDHMDGCSRASATTWHLVGLACDINFYSTRVASRPWYDPVAGKINGVNEKQTEYYRWPAYEDLRRWEVARTVRLSIAVPPGDDPRHVEYHPRIGTVPNWATPELSWFTIAKIGKCANGNDKYRAVRKIPFDKAWLDAMDIDFPPLDKLGPPGPYLVPI